MDNRTDNQWWVVSRLFKIMKYDYLSFPLEVSDILLLIPTEYMSLFWTCSSVRRIFITQTKTTGVLKEINTLFVSRSRAAESRVRRWVEESRQTRSVQ